jgi:hypothetical protein
LISALGARAGTVTAKEADGPRELLLQIPTKALRRPDVGYDESRMRIGFERFDHRLLWLRGKRARALYGLSLAAPAVRRPVRGTLAKTGEYLRSNSPGYIVCRAER